MSESNRIRVLLVDDQRLFVDSLKYVLNASAPDIEVIEIALDGKHAIEAAKRHMPDVVLMDVRMPGLDGIETMKAILESSPKAKIVMLSTFAEEEDVRKALREGAFGYIQKNIGPPQLIRSIRAAKAGFMQIDDTARKFVAGRRDDSRESRPRVEPLTKREREVLLLIIDSSDNREIAARLNVSDRTARNYVHNLYSKMGVSNRMHLQRLARELGLAEKKQ
jgi:DNA-binding NarL/FixJ family response regulator